MAQQIDRMTVAEKLQAMEALWQSLCQDEDRIPVPQWHKDILEQREREVKAGKAKFISLETAKQQIADEIRKRRTS